MYNQSMVNCCTCTSKGTQNMFAMPSIEPDEAMKREHTIDHKASSPSLRVKRFSLLLEIYRVWMQQRRRSGSNQQIKRDMSVMNGGGPIARDRE